MIASAVIGLRVLGGSAFDTDIQSLLPQSSLEPMIREAMVDANRVASSRIAVLVSSDQPGRAVEAAAALDQALSATRVYAPSRDDGEEIGRWLFANRNALLCEADPAKFDGAAAAQRSLALLFAPTAPISGAMLQNDPFLRTLTLSQCLAPSGAGALNGATLVSGRLEGSAFRLDVQDAVTAAFDAWRRDFPDVSAARTGAVFYAHQGASRARDEVSLIGGVSLLIVIGCLWLAFRRSSAVIGTLAVTTAGAIGSLGAALLVFPSVHVLVFVFGSALIGVTSDYALHYLATGPQTGWAPVKDRIRSVFRPLLVCAGATSLGFASLALFNVPIFDQVAVFSVAGIGTAWLFTLTLLPMMDPKPGNAERLSAWWAKLDAPFSKLRWPKQAGLIGAILLAAICIVGALRYSVLDDVRRFQPASPVLMAEEARVRDAIGFSASPSFLLSFGANSDEARRHEEAALGALPDAARADVLAASRFDPSQARRDANAQALRDRLYTPYLAERAEMLGVAPTPFVAEAAPPPRLIADLAGESEGRSFLIAPLGPAAIAAHPHGDGVILIDPAARYSQAFQSYRKFAGVAVALAFAVCGVIIVALYRTPRALAILAGPAIGVLLAIVAPAAFGLPASFFSVAALFVVIGAGVDHSVFQFEAATTRGDSIDLAVFLSAATTIASMGLLGLSSAYPVQIFGIAVAVGVTAAYVFSFIAAHIGRRKTG